MILNKKSIFCIYCCLCLISESFLSLYLSHEASSLNEQPTTQTDLSGVPRQTEPSASAHLVAMNPSDTPEKKKNLIRLHGCRKSTRLINFYAFMT